MSKNQILDVPIGQVIRPDIALPLQHVLKIYTVGNFLNAWRSPKQQRNIEQVFDTPQQARHAAATCGAWLGVKTLAAPNPVPAWWTHDSVTRASCPCPAGD